MNKVEANNIISSILTLPAYRQAGSAAVRADESRNISKLESPGRSAQAMMILESNKSNMT